MNTNLSPALKQHIEAYIDDIDNENLTNSIIYCPLDCIEDYLDETKFCMEVADAVRAKVSELEPDDKFTVLNMLDNFLHKIRLDVAEEWTYCAHCHTYVKTSERRIINNGDGTYNIACGNCGGYHYINKTN